MSAQWGLSRGIMGGEHCTTAVARCKAERVFEREKPKDWNDSVCLVYVLRSDSDKRYCYYISHIGTHFAMRSPFFIVAETWAILRLVYVTKSQRNSSDLCGLPRNATLHSHSTLL